MLLLREELEKARVVAAKAGAQRDPHRPKQRRRGDPREAKESWDKFRKERDYHRMHHRRVGVLGGLDSPSWIVPKCRVFMEF